MKSKQKFLISCAALLAAGTALAQEQTNVAAPAPAPEKSGGTKIVLELPELPAADKIKVKVSGLVQAQYVYANASGGNASDQNGFSIRRSSIGISADVGDDWSAKVVYEFDSKSNGGTEDNGYIDNATISRKFADVGTLTVGHKKTHFMHEEYSPSSKFLCLERSINSNFVSGNKYAKGLAGYHIGVFWDGKVSDAFDYGFSLTNAVAKDYDKRSNDLAVTGNIGYTLKLSGDSKLYFGLNGTVNYGNDGNDDENSALTNKGTVYGIEPYVQFTSGGLTLLADAYCIDGADSADIHSFYGVNLTAAYRLECGLEPAVRFTYLNTDSGLVNANIQNRVPASGDHDNATTYYAGANYYFNKYVKLAAGFEYGHYFVGGTHADDSFSFRTMLQVSF
ncbi:MAG: porin [Candidatus Spyradosoma sp.]